MIAMYVGFAVLSAMIAIVALHVYNDRTRTRDLRYDLKRAVENFTRYNRDIENLRTDIFGILRELGLKHERYVSDSELRIAGVGGKATVYNRLVGVHNDHDDSGAKISTLDYRYQMLRRDIGRIKERLDRLEPTPPVEPI